MFSDLNIASCLVSLRHLHIYKHKTNNKLIEEQIQTNTKHDAIFKSLNIENTFHTQQKITNKTVGNRNSNKHVVPSTVTNIGYNFRNRHTQQ